MIMYNRAGQYRPRRRDVDAEIASQGKWNRERANPFGIIPFLLIRKGERLNN